MRARNRRTVQTATRLHPADVVAVAVAAVIALGQLPRDHPLIPALRITLPARHPSSAPTFEASRPSIGRLHGPRTLPIGSTIQFHGRLPSGMTGAVLLEGTYSGKWQILAADEPSNGAYRTRAVVTRRGLLHLRLFYPDGSRWVGSVRVR